MGCLQSKDANLPAPEKYLKSRASLDISVSQKNSRTGSLLTDPETGVSPRTKSWTTYAFPEAWHRSLDGSIESRFMKLTDEKGETVMRVGRRGPTFDPLYYLKLDHGAFSEMQNRDKTQVRTADGTLKACVAFHMCTDINIFESFGAKGIDGPGYVVYGTTPHFKGQPPTENFQRHRASVRVGEGVRVRKQGREDGRRRVHRGGTLLLEDRVVRGEDVRGRQGRGGKVRRRGNRRGRRGRLQARADAGARRRRLGARRDGGSAAGGFVRRRGKNRDDRLPRGRRQRFVLAGGSDAAFFICTYVAAVKFNLFRKCVKK